QGPVPLRPVTLPRRQNVEALRELALQLLRWEQVRSCRRQLDRERQAVEPPADAPRRAFLVIADRVAGIDGPRPRSEESERRLVVERAEREIVLAGDAEQGPARDEQSQPGRRREQSREKRSLLDHMLEAVQHQERLAVT